MGVMMMMKTMLASCDIRGSFTLSMFSRNDWRIGVLLRSRVWQKSCSEIVAISRWAL